MGSDVPLVQPEWYALMFFSIASSGNARLVSAPTTSTNPFIKVWATLSPEGDVRVSILHKGLNTTTNATVSIDLSASLSTFPTGAVGRVRAPTPYSSYGLTLLGLTWDGTVDGRPSGQPEVERVDPSSSGVYTVTVSPISLVVLDIARTGSGALEQFSRYHLDTVKGRHQRARTHPQRAVEEGQQRKA